MRWWRRPQKCWGNHSSFKSGGGLDRGASQPSPSSTTTAPSTYSAEIFLERSIENMNGEFVTLPRGTVNPFIRNLFSPKTITHKSTRGTRRRSRRRCRASSRCVPRRRRRKGTVRRTAATSPGAADIPEEEEAPQNRRHVGRRGRFPRVADLVFATLEETQAWHVFCINPNDSQLPKQLGGRSVKGQIRSARLDADRVAEQDFLGRSGCLLMSFARTAFGLGNKDVVLGMHKISLTHVAFHKFEDFHRSRDVEEQKRNRVREAEVEGGLAADPYTPYPSSPHEHDANPWGRLRRRRRTDLYERDDDGYDEHKSLPMLRRGSMFGAGDTNGGPLLDKEALAGEVQEGETTEVLKESSAKTILKASRRHDRMIILPDPVYDLTGYVQNPRFLRAPSGTNPPADDTNVMSDKVVDIFKINASSDVTKDIDHLAGNGLTAEQLARQEGVPAQHLRRWARRLAAIGQMRLLDVPPPHHLRYHGVRYWLQAPRVHLPRRRAACYTEGTESLRKTIDSLAQLKYDDKRKLIVVIFGAVAKPTERSRPGNRGNRESQMLAMHFLNKVHFNAPMNPLELEMYHQVKNVTFADSRLISPMFHGKKLLGVGGETELANANQSIIAMVQVYGYFISHNMAKALESLFGSVTCLSGCFMLFRICEPDAHKPLLVSNQLIQDYSENRVDTLHMKKLLYLGEDRYLTTLLLLKHFPTFKTQFVRDKGKFDPRSIPLKSWNNYENEHWDKESNHGIGSWVPLPRLKNDGYAESHTASIYGRETAYKPSQSMFAPLMTAESRPMTNYLDSALRQKATSTGRFSRSTADLNTITKREIRRRLEAHFGMDGLVVAQDDDD
ncbi:Glycosyltransferase family 2 protein [Mycena kentingensis (nom. inval.)]|nr:Glycosyltransferase family 2 protein [Mycena kentingensis (nom. inval.)]